MDLLSIGLILGGVSLVIGCIDLPEYDVHGF